MPSVLSKYLKSKQADAITQERAAAICITRTNRDVLSITITDDKGNALIDVWSGTVKEYGTVTFMDIDEVFKVTI